jgi:HEPN domain-containing protein
MATIRNYADWFYVSSREWLEAYVVLDQDQSGRHDFIAIKHHLLCHALETALKGLLAETGTYSYEQLWKKFSHDLMKLLEEVEKVRGPSQEIEECKAYVRPILDDYIHGGYGYPNNNGRFRGIELKDFAKAVEFFVNALMKDIGSHKISEKPMPV